MTCSVTRRDLWALERGFRGFVEGGLRVYRGLRLGFVFVFVFGFELEAGGEIERELKRDVRRVRGVGRGLWCCW